MTNMAEQQLETTFVSDLEDASQLQDTDLFLISQNDGDGLVSKRLEYSILCSKVLTDVDEKIDAGVVAHIGGLSGDVSKLSGDLSALSGTVLQNVSATIKIANCVKKAKEDIAVHQGVFDGLSGEAGISVDKSISGAWRIKHVNAIAASNRPSFIKVQHDAQGHIDATSDVVLSDLTSAADGNLLTGVGSGLSVKSGSVSLLSASEDGVGGIKLGFQQSGDCYPLEVDISGKAYTTVPSISVGEGLSTSSKTISLSTASVTGLGGVKLGFQQRERYYPLCVDTNGKAYTEVPWTDTTYQCATASTAGLVKIGGNFKGEERRYSLAISSNGYAYVDVPWSDGSTSIGDTSLSVEEFEVISSVSTSKGELASLGKSTALYKALSTVSSDVYNLEIPKLSTQYLASSTTTLSFDATSNRLILKLNDNEVSETGLNLGEFQTITGCEYKTTVENEDETLSGHFLEFSTSDETTFYCDVSDLLKNTVKNYLSVVDALPAVNDADPDIYYFKND